MVFGEGLFHDPDSAAGIWRDGGGGLSGDGADRIKTRDFGAGAGESRKIVPGKKTSESGCLCFDSESRDGVACRIEASGGGFSGGVK